MSKFNFHKTDTRLEKVRGRPPSKHSSRLRAVVAGTSKVAGVARDFDGLTILVERQKGDKRGAKTTEENEATVTKINECQEVIANGLQLVEMTGSYSAATALIKNAALGGGDDQTEIVLATSQSVAEVESLKTQLYQTKLAAVERAAASHLEHVAKLLEIKKLEAQIDHLREKCAAATAAAATTVVVVEKPMSTLEKMKALRDKETLPAAELEQRLSNTSAELEAVRDDLDSTNMALDNKIREVEQWRTSAGISEQRARDAEARENEIAQRHNALHEQLGLLVVPREDSPAHAAPAAPAPAPALESLEDVKKQLAEMQRQLFMLKCDQTINNTTTMPPPPPAAALASPKTPKAKKAKKPAAPGAPKKAKHPPAPVTTTTVVSNNDEANTLVLQAKRGETVVIAINDLLKYETLRVRGTMNMLSTLVPVLIGISAETQADIIALENYDAAVAEAKAKAPTRAVNSDDDDDDKPKSAPPPPPPADDNNYFDVDDEERLLAPPPMDSIVIDLGGSSSDDEREAPKPKPKKRRLPPGVPHRPAAEVKRSAVVSSSNVDEPVKAPVVANIIEEIDGKFIICPKGTCGVSKAEHKHVVDALTEIGVQHVSEISTRNDNTTPTLLIFPAGDPIANTPPAFFRYKLFGQRVYSITIDELLNYITPEGGITDGNKNDGDGGKSDKTLNNEGAFQILLDAASEPRSDEEIRLVGISHAPAQMNITDQKLRTIWNQLSSQLAAPDTVYDDIIANYYVNLDVHRSERELRDGLLRLCGFVQGRAARS